MEKIKMIAAKMKVTWDKIYHSEYDYDTIDIEARNLDSQLSEL